MLKVNDWYFVPNSQVNGKDHLGMLNRVVEVDSNPNYCTVERWMVSLDRKYNHQGINSGDSVALTKYGKKVKPPSKMFQILFSETVKEKTTTDQDLDTDIEYNED